MLSDYKPKIMPTKNADLWGGYRNIILQQNTHESEILILAESEHLSHCCSLKFNTVKKNEALKEEPATAYDPSNQHICHSRTSPCPNLATINHPPFRSPRNDWEQDIEKEMDAPPTGGRRILPHHSRPLLLILNRPALRRSPIYSVIEPGLYGLCGT